MNTRTHTEHRLIKTFSHHSGLPYHSWKDVGGPVGLIFDIAFFVFVLIAGTFMILFCTTLLVLDYLAAPVLALMARVRARQPA